MRKVVIISLILLGFTSVYAFMPVLVTQTPTKEDLKSFKIALEEVQQVQDQMKELDQVEVIDSKKSHEQANNANQNLNKLIKVQKSLAVINDFINKEYSLSNNLSKDAKNRVELYSMVAPKVQLEFPSNPFMLEKSGYTSSVAIHSIQYTDNDQYEAIFIQTIKENNVTKDVRERKVFFTTQETPVTNINKYGIWITKIV